MKSPGLFYLCLGLATAAAAPAEPGPPIRPVATLTNFESNLPLVFLQTTQQIVANLKVPCEVRTLLPRGAKAGDPSPLTGQIRLHGASSLSYPKKSFGLTLDMPERWLGMPADTHWVLNAATVDRSLMRHKLAYDLFRSLSANGERRFAAASRFVEADLNGSYLGVYLLMERVDRTLLELGRLDSNAPIQACIYKAVDHPANFGRPDHEGFEQRLPDPALREYWGPLDELNRFTSGAPEGEFFDPQTGIGSRLDLDCAVDFHLLVLLTSNMDGIDKNFMLARRAPTAAAPKPRFFFVPWDYDATFGRNWEASRVPPTEWLSNHLFNRLLSQREYRQKFAARWRQLRAREFSLANLGRLIDDNARALGAAPQRNAARWEKLAGGYPDRLTFEDDLRQMKEWLAARTQWLDGEIARREGPAATGH